MRKKRIVDHIKEETEKLKKEEFSFPEIVECRNKISDSWELFCQKAEAANMSEDDMRSLVFVLTFLTQQYYEALPQRECNSECSETITREETLRKLDGLRYVLESTRLMHVQTTLIGNDFFSNDKEKVNKVLKKMKKNGKHISKEEMLQKIVDAQTKDPWIPEIGASVSTIRRFEELMGEYPEITGVLKKSNENQGIFI